MFALFFQRLARSSFSLFPEHVYLTLPSKGNNYDVGVKRLMRLLLLLLFLLLLLPMVEPMHFFILFRCEWKGESDKFMATHNSPVGVVAHNCGCVGTFGKGTRRHLEGLWLRNEFQRGTVKSLGINKEKISLLVDTWTMFLVKHVLNESLVWREDWIRWAK